LDWSFASLPQAISLCHIYQKRGQKSGPFQVKVTTAPNTHTHVARV
jgi:hypothetical protein